MYHTCDTHLPPLYHPCDTYVTPLCRPCDTICSLLLNPPPPSSVQVQVVIYTGDKGVTPGAILDKAQERFNVSIEGEGRRRVRFVYLSCRGLLEPSTYPRFTLLVTLAICHTFPTSFWQHPRNTLATSFVCDRGRAWAVWC